MRWPEASINIAGWLSAAIMICAIAKCTSGGSSTVDALISMSERQDICLDEAFANCVNGYDLVCTIKYFHKCMKQKDKL